jgi:hypothetical protein
MNQHQLSISVKELIDSNLRTSVAGAYRFQKANIAPHHGKQCAGTLMGDPKFHLLGFVARSSCFLMSARTFDPCTLIYIQTFSHTCLDPMNAGNLCDRRMPVGRVDADGNGTTTSDEK